MTALLVSLPLAYAAELHHAARRCDSHRLAQLLLQRPVLTELDENGMTPLHVAIDSRQKACVGLLLEAGADRRVRDRHGRTAINAARSITDVKDRATILLYLTRRPGEAMPTGRTTPMPWTLEHSVLHRQTAVTKMLLTMGADPNAIGAGGTSPLADAALKGDLDGLRLLLAHGARPNVVSQAGTQPIHDAALGDNAEVIKALIAQGADANARTRDEGQTPLHLAASMGKMKAIEALLALGADPTIKDSSGRTSSAAAQRLGLTDVVELLRAK